MKEGRESVISYLREMISFEEAVKRVINFALLEIQKEAEQKQLYYHTCDHARAVKRRADIIFKTIAPFWQEALESNMAPDYLKRTKHLIDISAIAHDLVQEFIPNANPHTSRQRESGVSEAATIAKLIDYIEDLNRQFCCQNSNNSALFTESDIQTIREAIKATVCAYDYSDHSIYQPDLYNRDQKLSLPARIIALADLGSLGMDGIEVYQREGSLLFLEDNLDIITIILNQATQNLGSNSTGKTQEQQELYENLRQRLIKRARFQINFAKGRESRFIRELESFPFGAISILKNQVFKYLNKDTIQILESITPTADETSLEELIEFFGLKKLVSRLNRKS